MADTTDGELTYNGEAVTHPNLYVRNLPPNMDQTSLEVLFRRFGPCTGCKFFKTAVVPYAFLRLGTPAEALAAIKAMNGTTVSGKVILVKSADSDAAYDLPNENLYVRNIPVSWNEEHIRQFFEKYGPLVSVRVLPPIATSVGQVAMVRYQQLEHAQAARDGINATTPEGEHLPLNVKYADHQDEKARKQQSRFVKAGSNGSAGGPFVPVDHRFAPYPGANGPPRFPLPPPGMPMPMGPHGMGMMVAPESGELIPFPPGGPGAPPPGPFLPPPEVMVDMGMPPPWVSAGPPVMFSMPPPPPPPPPPRPQHQPLSQQPPVVAIAMDAAAGLMLSPPTRPGSNGAIRPPQQPAAQQPGIIPVVPLAAGQLQPVPPAPVHQQPRPVGQPVPPQQQQSAASKPVASGGQPTQPQSLSGAQPPHTTYQAGSVNTSSVPMAYPGYDPQQYAHQPYGAMPCGYPGNPHDPYAQVPTHQAYDAHAAAYYAAYYGQPAAESAGPHSAAALGQAPDQSGGDPYHAYYYYQQYYGAMPQQPPQQALQQQQQPQTQRQPQTQQAYAPPGQTTSVVGTSSASAVAVTPAANATVIQAVPGQQPVLTTNGAPVTQPQQQQQQKGTLPWQLQGVPQPQPQPQQQQQASLTTVPPAVAIVASVSQQPTAVTNGPPSAAAAPGAATATASGITVTANGIGTSAAPPGFKPNCRVLVSNLPANLEKLQMYESFSPYGAVLAVHIHQNGGFGIVQFAERDSAVRAVEGMNGSMLRGAQIKVVLAEA